MEFGGNVMEAGLVRGKEVRQVLRNDLYFRSLLLFSDIDISKIKTMKIRDLQRIMNKRIT